LVFETSTKYLSSAIQDLYSDEMWTKLEGKFVIANFNVYAIPHTPEICTFLAAGIASLKTR
tara:strand:- start:1225 stop:1407 length:183 start_codon:yes stop_codon:yes gene_type:complete